MPSVFRPPRTTYPSYPLYYKYVAWRCWWWKIVSKGAYNNNDWDREQIGPLRWPTTTTTTTTTNQLLLIALKHHRFANFHLALEKPRWRRVVSCWFSRSSLCISLSTIRMYPGNVIKCFLITFANYGHLWLSFLNIVNIHDIDFVPENASVSAAGIGMLVWRRQAFIHFQRLVSGWLTGCGYGGDVMLFYSLAAIFYMRLHLHETFCGREWAGGELKQCKEAVPRRNRWRSAKTRSDS